LPTDVLETHPKLVFEESPSGCVRAYNLGFLASTGDWICHLNDDTEVCPNWLCILDLIQDRKSQGAFYLKEPDTNGFITNTVFNKLYGNFSVFPREFLSAVGLWDERYLHYGGDPDYSLQIYAQGYTVISTPDAKVIHHCEQVARQEHLRAEDCAKLSSKWKGIYY